MQALEQHRHQQAGANWQNQANISPDWQSMNYQSAGTTVLAAPQGAMSYTAANLFGK